MTGIVLAAAFGVAPWQPESRQSIGECRFFCNLRPGALRVTGLAGIPASISKGLAKVPQE
jgi:hypothetical protein